MTVRPDTEHGAAGAAPRGRRLAIATAIVLVIMLLDQFTKSLVRARLEIGETWPEGWELIRVAHVTNTGAAFGMFSDATTILTIGTIIASAVIAVLIYAFAGRHPWYSFCLSLVLAGALGNLIDRIRLGAVTDFIDPIAYPAFNVADSAIVIGVGTLLILTLLDGGDDDGAEETETETAAEGEAEEPASSRSEAPR